MCLPIVSFYVRPRKQEHDQDKEPEQEQDLLEFGIDIPEDKPPMKPTYRTGR